MKSGGWRRNSNDSEDCGSGRPRFERRVKSQRTGGDLFRTGHDSTGRPSGAGPIGGRHEFVRTPKFGIDERSGSWKDKHYGERAPWGGLTELALALYRACAVWLFWRDGEYAVVPFLALYTTGFLTVGWLTIAQSRAVRA